jgi:hypothetical protein
MTLIKVEDRDTRYYTQSGMVYNTLLLITAVVLWAMNVSWYPNLDGVSVYELSPTTPDKGLFMKTASKSNADNAFAAEAALMKYCIFPGVYNALISKIPTEVLPALSARGLLVKSAIDAQGFWDSIDLSSMKRSYTEYNLPYDNLVAPAGKIEPSSQYYPPVCRCMNKVFDTYGTAPNTEEQFQRAQAAVVDCLATRHIVKRQTLIGDSGAGNNAIKSRKYISRYALLFQLCFAFIIGALYNRIDFLTDFTGKSLWKGNLKYYAALVVAFVFLWLSPLCSAGAVDPSISINFSTIMFLPAFALGIPVEIMWSFVAKHVDVGRQTYMHPLSFYITISALYTIALVENGVFTLSVIITHLFQSNAMSIAYAGMLFASHGKIWKDSSSCRTGFILLIFLPATMHIYSMVPIYPVNCELSVLWGMPTIFATICYAKVLFVDHFMDDESSMKDNRYKVTHSDHLLNIGHLLVVALVVFYYIIQLASLQYGRSESYNMDATGGRLSRRLNFEFAEAGVTGIIKPLYNTLQLPFSQRFYINP